MESFDAFCFDLDGTIFVGNEILPGAKEMIEFVRRQHKKLLFITNSPTQTRKECQFRLEKMGITVKVEEIMTAPFISAMYFSEFFPDSLIYIVGEKAIEKEFKQFSLRVTADPMEATHILVGLDRDFTYEKLNLAMNAVRNGAKLVVTNPDPSCPVPGGYISDTLAIARSIEVASGHSIDKVIGKPSTYYGDKIYQTLKVERDRCLIIGDRLETDIKLGIINNFRTCLVLTGVAYREHIEEMKIYPDYIVENLLSLFENMSKGKVSEGR